MTFHIQVLSKIFLFESGKTNNLAQQRKAVFQMSGGKSVLPVSFYRLEVLEVLALSPDFVYRQYTKLLGAFSTYRCVQHIREWQKCLFTGFTEIKSKAFFTSGYTSHPCSHQPPHSPSRQKEHSKHAWRYLFCISHFVLTIFPFLPESVM